MYPKLDKVGLVRLADEMKAFAKSAVITDYDSFARGLRTPEEGMVKNEVEAGLIKVSGGVPQDMQPYTRFFTLDGDYKLQVIYFEIQLPDQYFRHFTLVNNKWFFPLDHDQAAMVMTEFIDINAAVRIVKTPPHVMFLLQEMENKP